MSTIPTTMKAKQKKNYKRNDAVNPNKVYFGKQHEQAIIEYATTLDVNIKTRLYITLIQPAFNEMVDKIVYTYKFNSLPNIEDLKDDCKVWLVTILDKYDVSKGSKAFSYFSVITKNWFIHKVKRINSGRELPLEEALQNPDNEPFIADNEYEVERERKEFWVALNNEIDDWQTDIEKEQERRIYEAIRTLLDRRHDIEIFNKKAIYLYIRELTGLNTKQIVVHLKKFKINFKDFMNDWHNGDIKYIKVDRLDEL